MRLVKRTGGANAYAANAAKAVPLARKLVGGVA